MFNPIHLARRAVVSALLGAALIGPAAAQPVVTLAGNLPVQLSAVATDGSGNVFVADSGANTVTEYFAAGGFTQTRQLAVATGNFLQPSGLAVDHDGNVFVTDQGHNEVKEILADGGYVLVKTLAVASGSFNLPGPITIDAAGNLFVIDLGTIGIKEILAQGGYVDVDTISNGGFLAPLGIAVDTFDNLFIAESSGNADQPGGNIVELTAASGFKTAITLPPAFTTPVGVAIDGQANLFVTDLGSAFFMEPSSVTEILAAGGYTSTKVLPASATLAPQDGIALDGGGDAFVFNRTSIAEITAASLYATVDPIATSPFKEPSGVAVDAIGDVFYIEAGDASIKEILAFSGYQAVATLPIPAGSFEQPQGIAVDGSGNLFVADGAGNAVKEVPAAGGYNTVTTLAAANGDFSNPSGLAVDSAGNVFVADTNNSEIKEILADGGYVAVNRIAPNGVFSQPHALALDSSANLFVVGFNAAQEVLAAGGYVTVKPLNLPPDGNGPMGVAVDAAANAFVTDFSHNTVTELTAASGYQTTMSIAAGNFDQPLGAAGGAGGNIFVADMGHNAVKEILLAAPTLAAAILPSARSVEVGSPATVFASMINGSTADLANCAPHLPGTAPSALTLDYRPTNPATNAVVGTLDQPVPIAAGASQSFVLGFTASAPAAALALPVVFLCDQSPAVAALPGVNTVDLLFSATPVADVIALAATATPDLTMHLVADTGAFAVATANAGATAILNVTTDTGSAALPLTTTICQTNAAGQCLAAPAASLSMSVAAGETSTFSIFGRATGAIPFAPGASRVFVRFTDGTGVSHGSTSVAVTTN